MMHSILSWYKSKKIKREKPLKKLFEGPVPAKPVRGLFIC